MEDYRQYQIDNRDHIREKSREWRQRNAGAVNLRKARWRASDPMRQVAETAQMRGNRVDARGSHTKEELASLLLFQKGKCANPYCRADLHTVKRDLDHKMPLSRGGSNGIENLQFLCSSCNAKKWTYSNEEWLERLSKRQAA